MPRQSKRAAAAAAAEEDDMVVGDGTISVKEIMGGRLIPKKVTRAYKRHARPIVTAAVKAAKPVMQQVIAKALPAALASVGVPPAAVAPLSEIGATLAVDALDAGLRTSGVTGEGMKHILPHHPAMPRFNERDVRATVKPKMSTSMTLMGAGIRPYDAVDELGIPSQMRSNAMAAVHQMNLNAGRPSYAASPESHALPPQMQSNLFTGQNLVYGVERRTGSGLFPATGGAGLYPATGGAGLYPAGRHMGRGLFA